MTVLWWLKLISVPFSIVIVLYLVGVKSGVLIHTYNLSTEKAEAGRLP